ncbi:hypothetical protein bAD24_p00495 (plasmid) [Burkholderia sp. AD24]|nr:hypothetical protein bAD24_p00495 [Burkholderia sp. AD24]
MKPYSVGIAILSLLFLTACAQRFSQSSATSPQTEVQATQSGHVQNSTDSRAATEQANATFSQSTIDQQIAADKQQVDAGLAPPNIIKYDLEIAGMMPEAKSLLAAHDQARARAWEAKYRSIVEARNRAIQNFLAPRIARNNAIANVLESSRLSRGSGPNGAQHNPNETFVCGSGPGPGQRQVGEDAGGNGVAPTPICSWN